MSTLSMALPHHHHLQALRIIILISALLCAIINIAAAGRLTDQPSTSHADVVKGSLSCIHCPPHFPLSGIKVAVVCERVKKVTVATTEDDGTFEAKLPSDNTHQYKTTPSQTPTCHASLMGGPSRLYTFNKNMVSKVVATKVKAHNVSDRNSYPYTISTPLTFYTSCPLSGGRKVVKCGGSSPDMAFRGSKTVDLPLPREWGLAPSSYYIPFFPIIGIP
ncbi:uncharacterized protein LOC131149806 [Malania oleifera]|uniref:uncharacterized protein LOC131149806 n=1 Tax=Malania oleifera TaxID=397392 RepID=UPI0025AE6172|nr:uncharacterized protein LOC131149806 [Malania oleifera]